MVKELPGNSQEDVGIAHLSQQEAKPSSHSQDQKRKKNEGEMSQSKLIVDGI